MSEQNLVIKSLARHTAEVFHFRYERACGWAIFTVCEATGELSVQSDWGEASYRWNPQHLGIDGDDRLKRFLARGNGDYVVRKLAINQPRLREQVIDYRATRRAAIEAIGAQHMDRKTRRALAEWLQELELDEHEAMCHAGPGIHGLFEPWETVVRVDDTNTVFWIQKLLPSFMTWLRDNGYGPSYPRVP